MANSIFIALQTGFWTFFATNIDDFLLLLVFLSRKSNRFSQVILGQYLGMIAILSLSWLSAELGTLIIPNQWQFLLAFIPISMGVYKLICPSQKENEAFAFKSKTLMIAATIFSSGGDNISVYSPLLANSSISIRIILIGVYLTLPALWVMSALLISRHLKTANTWKKPSEKLMALIYILIGVYILIVRCL